MTREETIKLLALIKVAYPTAYNDMDDTSKKATVNMWQVTFPDVPYTIMEMAFNRFRMASKFPPTVAEICVELKRLHDNAVGGAYIAAFHDQKDRLEVFEWIANHTRAFQNDDYMDIPVYSSVKKLADGTRAGAQLIEKGGDADA